TGEPPPEGSLAEPLIESEAKGLREPEGIAREGAEQYTADDRVMEVRHEEQTVVENEVRRRRGEQHSRHAADDEGHHEADRPEHGASEADATAIHGEEPVE